MINRENRLSLANFTPNPLVLAIAAHFLCAVAKFPPPTTTVRGTSLPEFPEKLKLTEREKEHDDRRLSERCRKNILHENREHIAVGDVKIDGLIRPCEGFADGFGIARPLVPRGTTALMEADHVFRRGKDN